VVEKRAIGGEESEPTRRVTCLESVEGRVERTCSRL
jgi:hypothetical protein